MNQPPRTSNYWFRFLLAFLVIASLLYLIPNRFINASKDQAEVDIKKLITEWGNCDFQRPTSNSVLQVLVSTNTAFSGTTRLTTDQQAAYINFVIAMFDSFSSGDYRRYRDWRFGAAVVPRQDFIDEVRTTIVKGYRMPPSGVYVKDKNVSDKVRSLLVSEAPNDPEKIFEQFVRLQSLGGFYADFWKGLCLKNMQLRFDVMTQAIPEVDQYEFNFIEEAGTNPHSAKAGIANIGLAIHPGFFTFKESPETILKETGNVLVAHALFMVDMSDGRGAGPIAIQAYWAPSARRWLPNGIAEGNLWRIRGIQLCF